MTRETNAGLLCLLSGKHTLHVVKASLALGLTGWQKCYSQDIAQSSPSITVQGLLKKTDFTLGILSPKAEGVCKDLHASMCVKNIAVG